MATMICTENKINMVISYDYCNLFDKNNLDIVKPSKKVLLPNYNLHLRKTFFKLRFDSVVIR